MLVAKQNKQSANPAETQSNQAAPLFFKPAIQTKLTINQPNDEYEQEADAMADKVMRMPDPVVNNDLFFQPIISSIQRKCAHCEEEDKKMQRKETNSDAALAAPQTEDYVNSLSGGRALNEKERKFFEPRMGYDFSDVKIHTDSNAIRSARSVNALAYTTGNNIVFNEGQYSPDTNNGKRLLGHELVHVVQQNGSDAILQQHVTLNSANDNTVNSVINEKASSRTLYRSVVPDYNTTDTAARGENNSGSGNNTVPAPTPPPRASVVPSPEVCPPPEEMSCPSAAASPGGVTNTFIFPQNSATLNPLQLAEIDAAAAAWHIAGSAATLRIDGYASAEGECSYNWNLSCRRAEAVVRELTSPGDGSSGVAMGNIQFFAHGESAESGSALGPNRMATISLPVIVPPPPPPPTCIYPVELGHARGCGSGSDFTHNDFPSISASSTAKLAAWAAARPFSRGPFRSLVTDTECELEMDSVLTALGGASGHAAYLRFEAGTGGTMTLGAGTTLGAMALVSPSFLATVAAVQRSIESQLAVQASSGALSPCALSVTPPATFFSFSDGTELKAVIGGTQGEKLFMTSFTGNSALRSYSVGLHFLICDDFGVDESDLYAPGLFPFWVLQHERGAAHYAPFINQLDLSVTVSGTF